MIKKISRLTLTFCMAILLPFIASASDFQEGEQYTQISEKISSKSEVREYFSFYCPHCFRFEPLMEQVKKGLPNGTKFERNHVDFLRTASPEIQFMLSKAVAVAQQLKMEKKLVNAIFNYIHVQRAMFSSEKDLRNVFVLNGVDGEKFDKLMKSFSVNSHAKRMKKQQDALTTKRALTAVPTIVVNGKYRINTDKLGKGNFEVNYKKLVAYLLTLK
jgi:thiol:disulfide interchange protein DsbA|tara:strand:+ start:630 stop:1277 length:648 start_codon:yes stop_codon:yes gene_type:complete